jgi:hypothetical protein
MIAIIHVYALGCDLYDMVWSIIFTMILILICWILFAPLELFVDTRAATIHLRWMGIGKAVVIYEDNNWWLKARVLFFSKKWNMAKLIMKKSKRKERSSATSKHKKRKQFPAQKFQHLIKTFRIKSWQLSVDMGDNVLNAWFYPLNFIAPTRQHLWINFTGENYLAITIKNTPARMLHAWINY